jgi:nitrite reductase (NADH) large subunit
VQHNGIFYGIWPAAEKQGEVAGINMAGGNAEYNGTTISNTLQVTGIDICAAGEIDAEGQKETVVFRDTDNYVYKKLVLDRNRIVGVILYGDVKDRLRIIKAMESGREIGQIRKELESWNLENL